MERVSKLVVTVGRTKGRVFDLEEGENLVGRLDAENEEELKVDLDDEDVDAKVSRQHAVIIVSANGGAVVEDLGSLNGSFIVREDGLEKLESGKQYQVQSGDELVFGNISLRYHEETI